MNINEELFERQRQHFLTGNTRDIKRRIDSVRSLGNELTKYQKQINEAVFLDLKKSGLELFSTEIAGLLHEIKWISAKLSKWTRPVAVPTNLLNLPGLSRILLEPFGNALIMGTWNYPFLLNLKPAISALAAGNCVIIKPSEFSPNSSKVLAEIVASAMPVDLCTVVGGGVIEVTELLKLPFDKIFFTGSTHVGKIVMRAAAENLSSLTLELGGKSPAFVLPDAVQPVTARRIAWGKFLNAGQTCVAPDFVLVHESVAESLIENLAVQLLSMFGQDPSKSADFGRIVDHRHFDRLVPMMEEKKTVIGGVHDRNDLYISPTVLFPASYSDASMQDEIFGPILPVIPYSNLQDAVNQVKSMPKPLSLYVFSQSKREREAILSGISFGGGCVNDTVMQIANPYLPFGGVGSSGSGRYHGRAGILEFSNQKSIIYKATWIDPFIRYPPFSGLKEKILRKLL